MRWLMLHEIPIETLIMRANDDYRPNAITKLQAVQTNFKTLSQIAFVLEDNESAVSALKGLGLTVLQVHVGGKNETTRAASSAGRPVREAQ
jgi:predicted phosphohydrolase